MSMAKETKRYVHDLQEAVWQYLVDHTVPSRRGYMIRFSVRDEKDFWHRVSARKEHGFVREDKEDMALRVQAQVMWSAAYEKKSARLTELRKNGGLFVKFAFFIRNALDEYLSRKAGYRDRKSVWRKTTEKGAWKKSELSPP